MDIVPNKDVNLTFLGMLRTRDRDKEILGDFKYKPQTSLERVLNEIGQRDCMYFGEADIYGGKLKYTL